MKTILIVFLVVMTSLNCPAQLSLDLFAGPQTTTAKYTIKNVKQPTEFKYGFHAGVGCKVFFDKNLYFSPDISYSLMGYKVAFNRPSFPPDALAKDNNTTFHEMDFDFLLQYDLGNNPGHFFIKGGAAISYIFSGKEEFNLATGEHVSRNMVFSFGDYGRYIGSAVADFGYETPSGFFIYAHYVHGIGSMNNADEGPHINTRVIGLTAGMLLNPRKLR
jgi:hypothetical protein